MKAIVVMFDSLNRRLLPTYGATEIVAPNFERLAGKTATFDNCYAGSMPCMPARREMHTGRHNFLHRSWSPLEPFDDSVPEMLKKSGVYTHISTDHQHYWEDGGATYLTRFNSFEMFRGQEGDPWKGHVADPVIPPTLNSSNFLTRQDWVNRQYLTDESQHPQTLTFDAGLHFLETNVAEDNWMLQIETFDPHEPFFSYKHYRDIYGPSGDVNFDWPAYRKVLENSEDVDEARKAYFALVSMCDRSLGRVIDFMDDNDMWHDTMLIVCTDHGFMLGEHGWWGKSVQPWYDETIHTPLFVWDPRSAVSGERRSSLVQTIDIGPTLLDWFGQPATQDMQGQSLAAVVREDEAIRETALFGAHGGHVSVTDGRYVYMRASVRPDNSPLYEYTLMPTHMRSRFEPAELLDAELVPAFTFTKGAPVLKIPAWAAGRPADFGTLLFDLSVDPDQNNPLIDDGVELHMIQQLLAGMRFNDAPPEQFDRLGLPRMGDAGPEHLMIRSQWANVQASRRPTALPSQFAPDAVINTVLLRDLLSRDDTKGLVIGTIPALESPYSRAMTAAQTVVAAAAAAPGIGVDQLESLERELIARLLGPR